MKFSLAVHTAHCSSLAPLFEWPERERQGERVSACTTPPTERDKYEEEKKARLTLVTFNGHGLESIVNGL